MLLAEYEKLSHTVSGTANDLRKWIFEDPVVDCLVAVEGGNVVGYAIFFRNFSTFRVKPGVWLEDVFVTPERRSAGIGKALLNAVIDFASERGYGRVEWSVLDWNEPAIKFYESIGADVMPDWRICRVSLP